LFVEREYGGDYLGDLPDGGYRALVEAMTAGLDVRLSRPVTEVRVSASGVQLQCAEGEVHEGSHVVVAVPLGVLKRGGLSFAPALPADRLAVIDRLGFGRYEKICLAFAEPFWRDAGVTHMAYFSGDPDEAAGWMIDHDAFGAGAAVTFHVFPSLAVRVLRDGDEGAKRWATDQLSGATGRPCPEPTAVAVTSWAEDPWTRGTYTHVPVGAEPADLDRLGEPVGDRILFAGEHTQSARIGYADGALTSGIREAKRLLGSPHVKLGPV
jgi:monoamine oxidase